MAGKVSGKHDVEARGEQRQVRHYFIVFFRVGVYRFVERLLGDHFGEKQNRNLYLYHELHF